MTVDNERKDNDVDVCGTLEFYLRYSSVPLPYAEQSHLHPLFRLCRWPWNYLLVHRQMPIPYSLTEIYMIYEKINLCGLVGLYNTKDICTYPIQKGLRMVVLNS